MTKLTEFFSFEVNFKEKLNVHVDSFLLHFLYNCNCLKFLGCIKNVFNECFNYNERLQVNKTFLTQRGRVLAAKNLTRKTLQNRRGLVTVARLCFSDLLMLDKSYWNQILKGITNLVVWGQRVLYEKKKKIFVSRE